MFHCGHAYSWANPRCKFPPLERSRVALDRRKSVMVALVLFGLAGLLGWAWTDGGARPLTPQSVPALLPEPGR